MNISRKNSMRLAFAAIACLALSLVSYVVLRSSSSRGQLMARVGDRSFLVEVADTPVLRERGLGSREQISPSQGMLFLFPDIGPDRHAFWMKGMRFPLDIAWIRDGQIVHIERNIPVGSEDIFRPPVIAESVLEVNAGEFADISLGDAVSVSGR